MNTLLFLYIVEILLIIYIVYEVISSRSFFAVVVSIIALWLCTFALVREERKAELVESEVGKHILCEPTIDDVNNGTARIDTIYSIKWKL